MSNELFIKNVLNDGVCVIHCIKAFIAHVNPKLPSPPLGDIFIKISFKFLYCLLIID